MRAHSILAAITLCMTLGLASCPGTGKADTPVRTVLSTTFPIHQIVRQVTAGRAGLSVVQMLPSQMGCPHDYALTTQDMQKLAKADVLVINGLGMEEFLGAPLKKANPKITLIDSSSGIKETLAYTDQPQAQAHTHAHAHTHAAINPHLFASPRMNARLALNIAAGLSKVDPEGAALYARNAEAYAGTMNRLADDMSALGKRLKNPRIMQPHGVFDYLARDMGLSIVAVMLAHGQEPSAAGIRRLAKTLRETQAGAVLTEPQYPGKIAQILSKETGVPFATLDPVASGPEDAPPDYYEKVMRQNMKTLASTLGVRQE